MLSDIMNSMDFNVIIASMSGALVYILTQHHFDRGKKPAIFFVSFFMGITGADATLVLARYFIPSDFTGERAAGAFLCSALVVTIIVKIIAYIEEKKS